MKLNYVDKMKDNPLVATTEAKASTLARNQSEEEEERKKLVLQERRAIVGLRVSVFVVLLVATVVVSVSTYNYTKNDQEQDFENQYEGYAQRLIEAFHEMFERKLGAFDALATTITSEANGAFPNVSLPDFAVRGSNSRVLAGAVNFAFAPMVTGKTREGWEAYVAERNIDIEQSYIDENRHLNAQDEQFELGLALNGAGWPTSNLSFPNHNPRIFSFDESIPSNASGPFFPFWMSSPALSNKGLINLNLLASSNVGPGLTAMLESGQAVVSPARNLQVDDGSGSLQFSETSNSFYRRSAFRHESEAFRGTPTSPIMYPVFDGFGSDRKIAGFINSHIYWIQFLAGILPENAGGVVAVLKNTQNQTFSFFVDGTTVVHLGEGDFHDTKFDRLERSADIALYVKERAKPSTRAYTTVDLNSDFCSYTILIYPSNDLEDEYVDERPIWYTIGAVCIFVFTSMVFVTYDWLMERRQRAVVDQAVNYFGVVSSLFPRTVRERMLEEVDNKMKKDDTTSVSGNKQGRIADLFENCTVFFADIAGFTKWSSGRDPDEVFELLETMYGVFDSLAEELGVFKIETIGDCYLAVTGVPEPQDDHAVIMVRFATDCLTRTGEVLEELSLALGEETPELGIRIGIHSGPVIAGVLRGQRRRFQLFGDTVNTASRMESTGVKGKIHASEQTVKELISNGKEDWVKAREDRIVAKGKGELQTYWIDAADSGSSSVDAGATIDYTESNAVKNSVEVLPTGSGKKDDSFGSSNGATGVEDSKLSVRLHRH